MKTKNPNKNNHPNTFQSLYKYSFESSPTPTWIEDYSELYDFISQLKKRNIKNISKYFNKRPQLVRECAKKIVVIDVNKAAIKLHNAKNKRQLLNFIDNSFTEKSYKLFKNELVSLYNGEKYYESEGEIKTFSNEILEVILRSNLKIEKYNSHKSVTSIVSLVDVTKQRIYKKIIDKSNVIVIDWEATKGNPEVFVSENVEWVTGYTSKDFVSGKLTFKNLIHPDDKDRVDKEIPPFFKNKNITSFTFKPYRIITKDKKIRWIEDKTIVLRNSKKEIIRFQGIITDITDRILAWKKSETAEKIINSSVSAAFVWLNKKGWPVSYVSENVKNIFGYTADEFINGETPSYDEFIHPEDIKRVTKEVQLYSSKKDKKFFQHKPYRIISKNGTIKWVDDKTNITRDKSDKIISYSGIITDITNRTLAWEKANKAEKIINSSKTIAFIWSNTKGWPVTFVTENVKKTFGYSAEEFINGKAPTFNELVHPDDARRVLEEGKKNRLSESTKFYHHPPYRIITKKGKTKWIEDKTKIIRNSKGKAISFYGIVTDITARMEVKNKLVKEELKFKNLVENSLSGVYIIQDRKFRYVNPTFAKMFGYKQNELIDKLSVNDLVTPQDRDLVSDNIRKRLEGKKKSLNYIFKGLTKNKKKIVVEVFGSFSNYKNKPAIVGTILDITEKNLSKQKIIDERKKYRDLIESSNTIMWEYLLEEDKFIYVSPQIKNILGYSPSVWTNLESWGKTIHPEDRDYAINHCLAQTQKGLDHSFTYRLINKKGKIIWFRDIITVIKENNIPKTLIGILINIDNIKKSQSLLYIQEKALNSTVNGIVISSENIKGSPIIYCNKAFEKITGYKTNDVLGKSLKFLQKRDNKQPGIEIIRESIKQKIDSTVVIRNYKKNGKMFWNELTISPILDSKGKATHFVGIINDITKRKKTEEELKVSETLFRTSFFTTPDLIVITNQSNGKILNVNDAFLKHTRYKRSEIVGKTTFEINIWGDINDRKNLLLELNKKGFVKNFQISFNLKNGEKRIGSMSANIMNINNLPILYTATRDITKQKQIELALKKSKERYSHFVSQINEGVYRFEICPPMPLNLSVEKQIDYMYDNVVVAECNKALLKMYGLKSANDFVGKSLVYFHGGRNNKINREALRTFIKSGYKTEHSVTKELNLKGKLIFIDNNAIGVIANNRLERIWGTQSDITPQKKAELALTESEKKFRTLTEYTNSSILIMQDEKIVYVNKSFTKTTGYNLKDLKKIPSWNLIHPDYKEIVKKRALLRQAGKKELNNYEFKLITKKGKVIWIDFSATIINYLGKTAVLGTGFDITEKKQAEILLKESEDKFRNIVENSHEGIALVDNNFTIIYANKNLLKLFGNPKNELIGSKIQNHIAEDSKQLVLKRYKQRQKGLNIPQKYRLNIRRKNGQIRNVEISSAIFKDENGKVKTISQLKDITTQLKTERLLQESEEKFRTLTETTNAGIFIVAGDHFTYVNPGFERITGYTAKEAFKTKFYKLITPEFRELVKKRSYARQRGEKVITNYEFKIITKSGKEKWVEFTSNNIKHPGGQIALGTIFDITDRKIYSNQILENKNKLSDLATHLQTVREEERKNLGRELHDQLGQLLTVSKLDLYDLYKNVKNKSITDKQIINNVKGVVSMVDESIKFTKKIVSELRPELLQVMGLIDAIKEMLENVEDKTKFKTIFRTKFDYIDIKIEKSLPVFRIIQESITNAIKYSKAKKIIVDLKQKNNTLIIKIIDDGVGFDKTKKKLGHYGIIGMEERVIPINGKVSINSEIGKGTTVDLQLPIK